MRDGLFPSPLRSRNAVRMDGANFTADSIADRFGLGRRSAWAQQISVVWTPIVEGRYTTYTGDQELWVVPGRRIRISWARPRDLLAAAILESMADWPEDVWSYEFRRLSPHHRHRPDPQNWPSPARSFIETDDWFPMADPGRLTTGTSTCARWVELRRDHERGSAPLCTSRSGRPSSATRCFPPPHNAGLRASASASGTHPTLQDVALTSLVHSSLPQALRTQSSLGPASGEQGVVGICRASSPKSDSASRVGGFTRQRHVGG